MDKKTVQRHNITFKLIYSIYGSSKDKLKEDPNYEYSISLIKKNLIKRNEEKKYTKMIKLKVGIMYFSNEIFYFSDIDLQNDNLEISTRLISTDNLLKQSKVTIIRVKDLEKGKETESLLTLSSQTVLHVKYVIDNETVNIPVIDNLYKTKEEKELMESIMEKKVNKHKNTNSNKMPNIPIPISMSGSNIKKRISSYKVNVNSKEVVNPNNSNTSKSLNKINSFTSKLPTGNNNSNSTRNISNNKANTNDNNTNNTSNLKGTTNISVNNNTTNIYINFNPNDSTTNTNTNTFNTNSITPEKINKHKSVSPSNQSNQPNQPNHNQSQPNHNQENTNTLNNNNNTNTNTFISHTNNLNNNNNISSNLTNQFNSLSANTTLNREKTIIIKDNLSNTSNTINNTNTNTNNPNNLLNIKTNLNKSSNQSNQTLIIDHIELNYQDYSELETGDNFIEAIFLAGLPKKDAKIMAESDSKKFISSCKHTNCNILHSYKPEILIKFPSLGRSALDLTSVAASLCFTQGIKLCYCNSDSKIFQNHSEEDYLNIITNEMGERFYLYNYHFYIKYDYLEFQKDYDFSPVKDFFKYSNIYPLLQEKKEDKIRLEKQMESNLAICTEFINSDYVYIPYCFSMLSKHPYTNQINMCLENLVSIIFNRKTCTTNVPNLSTTPNVPNKNILLPFLKHLIYEIPTPGFEISTNLSNFSNNFTHNKKLKFFIPNSSTNTIELSSNSNKLPLQSYNISVLFKYFSVENILIIFILLLTENKVLFVSKSKNLLTRIQESFKSLLYPLNWVNTYIPVLSEELIKFLQSFMPFLMGIEETLFDIKSTKEFLDSHENIFIVNIGKNSIETLEGSSNTGNSMAYNNNTCNSNPNNIKYKKVTKKNLNKFIPEPDSNEYEELYTNIKDIVLMYEKIQQNPKKNISEDKLNLLVIKTFCTFLVKAFGDFQKHLSYIEGIACFNLELYLSNKPSKFVQFYTEIVQTQMFSMFLQNNPTNNVVFNKLVLRHSNNSGQKLSSKDSTKNLMSFFKKKSSNIEENMMVIDESNIAGNTGNSGNMEKNNSNNSNPNNKSNLSYRSDSSKNNSHEISQDKEDREYYIPPFFLDNNISDITKIEDNIKEFSKAEFINQNNKNNTTNTTNTTNTINNKNSKNTKFTTTTTTTTNNPNTTNRIYANSGLNYFYQSLFEFKEEKEQFKRYCFNNNSNIIGGSLNMNNILNNINNNIDDLNAKKIISSSKLNSSILEKKKTLFSKKPNSKISNLDK